MGTSWFTPIDAYCERVDPNFWSEPVNALTNGAFFAAGIAAYLILNNRHDRPVLLLIALTFLIGAGSFLFHTFANRWSALADVVPIGIFILAYFFLAMRRFLGLSLMGAIGATIGFQGLSVLITWLWRNAVVTPLGSDPINGSAGYLPALLAIIGVGLATMRRDPATARRLFMAGGVFTLSLTCRALDARICGAVPLGSHFLWHILNGTVLFLLMRAAIIQGREATAVLGCDVRT
ncbi:MAG: ceramidase domain-containing protein [Chelatococcus sp.]|nr:ceramidase domain-containing protein [Chelatococcus sp.]MBS7699521.1 ceramidase domain-containing protein [Chelatococcus sp. YT9]MBX3559560.1 ceramidase domain-containing protein [Chelatococcus sp.]